MNSNLACPALATLNECQRCLQQLCRNDTIIAVREVPRFAEGSAYALPRQSCLNEAQVFRYRFRQKQ